MSEPSQDRLAQAIIEALKGGPARIGEVLERVQRSTGADEDQVRTAIWRLIDEGAVQVNQARHLAASGAG